MVSIILPFLVSFLLLILSMAFFTLLERKILGYAQLRKGPNKVMIAGIPQPIADALKLFMKERTSPMKSNKMPYEIAPIFSLVLALTIWSLYSSQYNTVFFAFGVLFFLALSSLNVYGTLLAGWSSNSKYALLGALRAIAQTISYEVSMMLIILIPLMLSSSLNFEYMNLMQKQIYYMVMMPPLLIMWFTSTLAETNRAPFDFAEGESELVSGFNVEYSGTTFAFIFMAEYVSILFMSFATVVIFLGGTPNNLLSLLTFWGMTLLISILFLTSRATLPRMRYDLLMSLTWKIFLPASLLAFMFYLSLVPPLVFY